MKLLYPPIQKISLAKLTYGLGLLVSASKHGLYNLRASLRDSWLVWKAMGFFWRGFSKSTNKVQILDSPASYFSIRRVMIREIGKVACQILHRSSGGRFGKSVNSFKF